MALSERIAVGSREILDNGVIQVRIDTVIERDGVEISRTYHRHVLEPGDSIVNEFPSVQRIALAEHTPERIAAYKLEMLEARE